MGVVRRMRRGIGRLLALAVLCAGTALPVSSVSAQSNDISMQDITRLGGHGTDKLWGIGLVFGLPGTGDSSKVLPKARMLAELMQQGGAPAAGIDEMFEARSVAVVMVTASLPEGGAVDGDLYHLDVQTMFDAKSLDGGNLMLTPMRGSMPTDPTVYAMGHGKIVVEGRFSTSGRVSNGCRLIADIRRIAVKDGRLLLNVRENFASMTVTDLLANLINQDRQGLRADGQPPIAWAVDDRSVVVEIPAEELENPVRFISQIQKITFDESLLQIEPRIVINEQAGVIAITGNVVVRTSILSSGKLVITQIEPEIPATAQNPVIRQSNSALLSTTANRQPTASAQAVLEAMRRLDVPVQEQIAMFKALADSGGLSVRPIFQ